jgi:ABC-type spermidine/putrescine transport system permease subunit II
VTPEINALASLMLLFVIMAVLLTGRILSNKPLGSE